MSELTTAATVLGSALAVAKPVVETGCTLLEKLLGKPCEIAGGMLADQIYSWQWCNRVKIAYKANKILEQGNVTADVLPPGFLIPLLDAAGDVDDPTLQEMWAQLLAGAASSRNSRHPGFTTVLKQFSRDEALLFAAAASQRQESYPYNRRDFAFTQIYLWKYEDDPDGRAGCTGIMAPAQYLWRIESGHDTLDTIEDEDSIEFYGQHLQSLGLTEWQNVQTNHVPTSMRQLGENHFLHSAFTLLLSDYGKSFYRACVPFQQQDSSVGTQRP